MTTRKPLIPEPPSAENREQFLSTPWTAPYFSNPSLIPITNESRVLRPESTRETLLSITLNTPSTISAWQNFHHPPTPEMPFGGIDALVKLGGDLNGHTDIAHGGFVGVLLDEIIGMAASYLAEDLKFTMTAYLNIGYKKPIMTPSVLLCRGWVEKKEGRKIWGRGTVEDGAGGVLATGDALFVVLKDKQAKL